MSVHTLSQKRYVLSFDALNVIRDFTLFESAELIDLSNWTKTEKKYLNLRSRKKNVNK